MSQLACLRAMQLAQRSQASVDGTSRDHVIDEAERLRLEEHLGSCASCARAASLLEAIVRVARSADSLDSGARQRVFQRALRARSTAPRVVAVSRTWPTFALAAACAVLLVGLAIWRFRAPPVAPTADQLAAPPGDLGDGAGPQPAAASAARGYELAASEIVKLEGAELIGLEASAVQWDPASATLRVVRGALRIEVVPGRTQPFRVLTDRYQVEVLGTIFEVHPAEVSVERGKVRVSRAEGDPAPRVLGPGERWKLDGETSSADVDQDAPAASASASAPTAASTADGAVAAAPRLVDGRALFARARKHLAAGESKQARRLVEQALAGDLPAAQQAEGQTLLAECSLVAGDSKDAARRYAEVARKHGDLPAGETALFAAGRTAHGAGQKAEARRLLNQYLARYPGGQFANEARSRLAQLGP